MASSNSRAVSTSPRIKPALLAPRLCTYRMAPLVTLISRPRSPAWITSSAVITLVMLPIGLATPKSLAHSTTPVRASTSPPPQAFSRSAPASGTTTGTAASPGDGTGDATAGEAVVTVAASTTKPAARALAWPSRRLARTMRFNQHARATVAQQAKRAFPPGASLVVARRRVRVPLPLGEQLILVVLTADLGPRLLEHVRPGNVRLRRRIGRRGHLVRVVVVEPGLHPLLLGQPGELVIVEAPGNAAVLTAVAVKLLGLRLRVLLTHDTSTLPRRRWSSSGERSLRAHVIPGGARRAGPS